MKEVKIMKKQDKLDCQKIKEMIINNTLSISALSESHLNMLIEYETECLMECETEYDMAFMDLCCNVLERIHPLPVPTDDKIEEIAEKTYRHHPNNGFDNNRTNKIKTMSTRKLIRYLIAAAILLVALTATAAAVWNPFVSWLKERKLIDVKQGEVLENESGNLTVDTQTQSFDSVSKMENSVGIHFEIFDNIFISPEFIQLSQHGIKKEVKLQYIINQEKIVLTIYLENAPYKEEYLQNAAYEKYTLANMDWYVIENENITIIFFDNIYVYTITADSLDTIITFIGGN